MCVKLAISQQLIYMILSNFNILCKSTCSFHWLLNCSWLRPIYNRNSVSNLTVFSARLFYLYYIKSIIYARCQKLLVKLNFSATILYRILSNLCIFYKFICPFLSSSYLNLVGFGLYTTEILSQTSPYFPRLLKPIYTAKLNPQFLSGYLIKFFYTFIYCSKLFSLSTDC